MFISAFSVIVNIWKQPKCLSTDEWIKNLRCMYTMEHYSALRKNEIMPFATRWMDLETFIPSEVTQRQISYSITYMWHLKKWYK